MLHRLGPSAAAAQAAHPAMEMSKGKVTVAADTTGGMCSRRALTVLTIAARRSSSADCSRAARAARTAGDSSRVYFCTCHFAMASSSLQHRLETMACNRHAGLQRQLRDDVCFNLLRRQKVHAVVTFDIWDGSRAPLFSAGEFCSSEASPDSTTCRSMTLPIAAGALKLDAGQHDSMSHEPLAAKGSALACSDPQLQDRDPKFPAPGKGNVPLLPEKPFLLLAEGEAPLLTHPLLVERQQHLRVAARMAEPNAVDSGVGAGAAGCPKPVPGGAGCRITCTGCFGQIVVQGTFAHLIAPPRVLCRPGAEAVNLLGDAPVDAGVAAPRLCWCGRASGSFASRRCSQPQAAVCIGRDGHARVRIKVLRLAYTWRLHRANTRERANKRSPKSKEVAKRT